MSQAIQGIQRIFCQTPIWDLLRLRLTRDLDWRSAIDQSGLPDNIQMLIRDVLRRSRLMRFEKVAVTRELISHFQDGQAKGVSFETLVKEFGDIQVASTLIRRSKIRNRPMFMKIFRALGWCSLGMLGTYLGLLIFFHLGKPTPRIDFLAQLQQRDEDVGEDEKAWPIYREVWIKHRFCEANYPELYSIGADSAHELVRPSDSEWPAAVKFLEEKQDLLDAFRRGAKLATLGLSEKARISDYSEVDRTALFPNYDPSDDGNIFGDIEGSSAEAVKLMEGSLVGVLLPHIQSMRLAANMLRVDTRLAIIENDPDRALENLDASIGLARQVAQNKFVVSGLVGAAITEVVFDQIEETISNQPGFFSEQQLEHLQKSVDSISLRGLIKFEGERLSFHDILQRVYTDDGNGDGRITPQGLEIISGIRTAWGGPYGTGESVSDAISFLPAVLGPASVLTYASRKETQQKFDEALEQSIADFQQPLWSESDLFANEKALKHDSKFQLASSLFVPMYGVHQIIETKIARQDGVSMALAIYRYQRQNGHWPESIADLSPDFVTEIPQDRLTGGLVKFKIVDDRPRVYGVGSDLDDDGGKPVFEEESFEIVLIKHRSDVAKDGDWILWPQDADAWQTKD